MKKINSITFYLFLTTLFMFVVSPFQIWAQKAEYANIEKIAIKAFALNTGIEKRSLVVKQVIPVSKDNEVSFYIFNFEPQGHIVIAAEKFANPVLGYDLTSNIDFDSIPPGLNCLLENFNNEISSARAKKIKAEKETEDKWDYYLNIEESALSLKSYSIGTYLLSTTWGNYNSSCPIYPPTGLRSTVGCGGVALGQLLYYWNCRVFPAGQISYTPPNFTNPVTATLYNQNYNWQNMSTSSADSYNELLLFHCAASLESEFSSGQTTSIFDKMNTALRDNFGLNVSSKVYKSDYNIDDWYNLLKSDLNAGRPFLYRGQGTSGGHVWVIDGYKADNTFHCNWGWDGNYNSTWYSLNALNTPNGNFNTEQSAMINIYPGLDACKDIPGSNLVCTSTTSYTITLPATARVVWSKSSNLMQVGGNTSTTFTVCAASASTSGEGTITASIINGLNQTVLSRSKTIWIGPPSYNLTGDSELPLGTRFGYAYVNYAPTSTQYISSSQWRVFGPLLLVTGNSGYGKFRILGQPGFRSISADICNACGCTYHSMRVHVAGDPIYQESIGYDNELQNQNEQILSTSSISLSPNPAIDEVTLTIKPESREAISPDAEWDLQIFDTMQALKEQRNHISGSQYKINTSGWSEGLYFVRLKFNNQILTGKIAVRH